MSAPSFLAWSRSSRPALALRRFALLVGGAAAAPFVLAESKAPTEFDRPNPSPFVVAGAYTGEVLAVTSGGIARGIANRGLAEASIDANLAAWGAPAALTVHLSAHAPHGGDFSGTKLGDLHGASNIAAYNHPLLFELWLGGTCADRRAEFRLGRLAADAHFAVTEGGASFLNSGFGWPAFVSANTRNTGPAYNRTATGGFTRVSVTDGIHLQVGVYDGDSFDDPDGDPSRHPNGLHFEFGRGQGLFAIAEITLARSPDASNGGRAAALKLGAWQHTADFADQLDLTLDHSGNRGCYAVAEATLWSETAGGLAPDPRRLTAFGRFGVSPRQRSRLHQTADAGLSFTGLLPGRRTDVFGLGAAWARVSPDARQAERLAGASVLPDYELVLEANYVVTLGEGWRIIPDLQWVRHPGGSPALRDALVLGLRTRLEF